MNKSLFKKVRATLTDLPRYISETPTLSSTLFCDNFVKLTVIFVILLHKTVVYQKLIRQQYAPCPSASVMILQKGAFISLEGRHLVLTLLVSRTNTTSENSAYSN